MRLFTHSGRTRRKARYTVSSLKRDDILAVKDIKIELVPVPEWGGEVYIKGMSGLERDAFEASVIEQKGNKQKVNMANVRAKLAAQTLCDEEGNRLFNDADIKELGKKSASALQRVFEVAQRLSGIGDADVEELAGELQENPTEDSPSD